MKTSLALLLVSSALFGITLPENAPFPGGVIVKEFKSEVMPKAYCGDRRLMVLPSDEKNSYFSDEKNSYFVVAGVGLNQQIKKPYKMTLEEGKKKRSYSVGLQDKAYKKQYITIKDKRKVSPEKMDSGMSPAVPEKRWHSSRRRSSNRSP